MAPPAGPQETGAICASCARAGKPIDLTNGNTYIEQSDISLPGLGGGLTLNRRWNSVWPKTQQGVSGGMFGEHWRSTYEERLAMGGDGTMKYARNDGSFWSFAENAITWPLWGTVAPANGDATFGSTSTTWTITFKNGEKRNFNPVGGALTSIVDRSGNTTQLSYDGQGRLTTVADPAGRHLYFNYVSSSSYLVSSITSDFGVSIAYLYDTQSRLSKVTYPDQSFVTFDYDTNSLIAAVRDSDGKILESHTYDANGRGLSSSRADGVESLTVTYPVSPSN
jgi:YD repeat-containing protein